MKRILTLLVVASLVTSPAFAYGPDKPEKVNLSEAAAEAALEVVAAESAGLELTPPPQYVAGVNGGEPVVQRLGGSSGQFDGHGQARMRRLRERRRRHCTILSVPTPENGHPCRKADTKKAADRPPFCSNVARPTG